MHRSRFQANSQASGAVEVPELWLRGTGNLHKQLLAINREAQLQNSRQGQNKEKLFTPNSIRSGPRLAAGS